MLMLLVLLSALVFGCRYFVRVPISDLSLIVACLLWLPDCNICGFGRVRSRPSKIIKGTKKAAYSPEIRHSAQGSARRLASPLFLPAASSYREVLTVAQLNKAEAACAEADAARPDEGFCHAAPRLFLLRLFPPLTHLSLSVQGLRPVG